MAQIVGIRKEQLIERYDFIRNLKESGLFEEGDFSQVGTTQLFSNSMGYIPYPVINDICHTCKTKKLQVDSFRCSPKTIYSLVEDEKIIPFATIKFLKRKFWFNKEIIKVNIPLGKISYAKDALDDYVNRFPSNSDKSFLINQVSKIKKKLEEK